MGLYEILTNRSAVWILKVLHDNEVHKKAYMIRSSDLAHASNPPKLPEDAISVLQSHNLISTEMINDERIFSITQKGAKFIETFDQLVSVMNHKVQMQIKQPAQQKVRVEYGLNAFEKKILESIMILQKKKKSQYLELGEVSHHMYKTKRTPPTVSKAVNSLHDLNLIEKKKSGEKFSVALTPSGLKVLGLQ